MPRSLTKTCPHVSLRAAVATAMAAASIVIVAPAFSGEASIEPKIAPWLGERLQQQGETEFLVILDSKSRPPIEAGLKPEELYAALTASARADQAGVLADLRARGVKARSFYIVNAIQVKGDAGLAQALAARPEVARIVGNPWIQGVTGTPSGGGGIVPAVIQWNIAMVRAPEVWSSYGTQGEGVVVASADTGVNWAHADIRYQYRGYDPVNGEADHTYNWHDAFGTYTAEPWDDNGHGTHTTGTMVATTAGVAPAARWIACKNMNGGYGTPASYIDCMEWTLAPYPQGGDPLTQGRPDLAPQIVNNSWSCAPSEGCDAHTLDEALARVRQAGILMVGSAMNTGPACSTVDMPPALSEDALTVGAVDSQRRITPFSSRGPVIVDGSSRMKPDLVAPGKDIYSIWPDSTYRTMNGTSMAAPHVSGAAALLWSYRPGLRGHVDITRCVLERSTSTSVTDPNAQTCGGIPAGTFPNNIFGNGLLDIYGAFSLPASDADPAPDVCDCAPADASAWGFPVEITDVRVSPGAVIEWDAQGADTGPGTGYDVLRGDLSTMRVDRDVTGAACLARNLATPSTIDPDPLSPGSGVYYLVRARNACGDAGWGAGRQNTTCD